MKAEFLMPGMTGAAKSETGPSGGMSPANHIAWLEQLESAQWQQRLRYQSNGEPKQRPMEAAATGQRADTSARNAATAQTRESFLAGGRVPATRAVPFAQGPLQAVITTTALTGGGRSLEMAVLAPLQQRYVFAGYERYTSMQHHPGLQLRQQLAATWQAQHMHVMQGPTGLRVWMRDARHDQGEGYRLLRELRGHFARLGLRLAQFTLNGTELSKSSRFD